MSKILYHITTKKALQNIMKEGIIKTKRPLWDYLNPLNFKSHPKAIYLTKSPYWFKTLHESLWPPDFNEAVILSIDITKLNTKIDYHYPNSYYVSEDIPTNKIIQVFYITDKHLEMELKLVPKKFIRKNKKLE